MKTKFFSFVLLIQLILPIASYAQSEAVSNGLNWIRANQAADGSWSSTQSTSTVYYTTVSVLDTLAALCEPNSTAYKNGLAWARNTLVEGATYVAPRVWAVAASGADATTDLNTIRSYYNGSGWGGDKEYSTTTFHTAISLHALKAARNPDTAVVNTALAYLTTNQQTDGGWGFTDGDESSVFITAHVLSTLSLFKSQYIMDQQLKNAATFLLSKQNPDGGFGSEGSTTYETALAFIALIETGQGSAQALQNAAAYLGSTQLANGSWNDDPYSTALAVRALALVKPDLSIAASDIVALPLDPTVGDNITLTATVRNPGLDSSGGFSVRLLDNGVAVGEQIVSDIPAGGSAPAVFAVNVSPYGDHTFNILVDAANSIPETVENNNSASIRVWAKTPADLVLMPEYISISPAYPRPGEAITLTATVANMGENIAGAFDTDVYDGDPNNGGAKVGSFSIAGILPGQSAIGTLSFTLAATGTHSLHLVADPANAVSEGSDTNNAAAKEITVSASTGTGYTDLALPAGGLSVTPYRPATGETVSVTLLAGNLGTETTASEVEIFDGDPAAGGVLIHTSSVNLSPGETRTITAYWVVPEGIHSLRAYIDRTNQVAERDETNNSQPFTLMADMVDIEVSASDISIEPEHPMDGDPATVNVVVHNRGIVGSGPFNINLYNGDPESGGTLLQTFPVADLAGDATQAVTHTFTAARGTYRFYVVCDSEKKVAELTEDNNLAIRSLLVKTSAEAKGPDLVPLELDLSGATTDPETLRVSGVAEVKFQNKGDDKVNTPFRISVFEDKDGDGIYTDGTDLSLGYWDYTAPMNPSMVGTVTINVAGTVTFRDASVFAMVDSSEAVFEQNKNNNSIRKGSACEARPATPIEPVLKWQWRGGNTKCSGFQVTPPIVVGLTDDNGDGEIDNKDTPSVVLQTQNWEYCYMQPLFGKEGGGMVKALNGKTGAELWTIKNPSHTFRNEGLVTAGDLNHDGKPEVVIANGLPMGLMAYSNAGKLLWDNTAATQAWILQMKTHVVDLGSNRVQKLADVDGDGTPEIISGGTVFNADGSGRFARVGGEGGGGPLGGLYALSAVADLDLDGKQEIVAGRTAYNSDGSIKWNYPALPDGASFVGNFDEDPTPEIVLAANQQQGFELYMLEHDGTIKWGPVRLASMEGAWPYNYGGIPTIADFDADGETEIGIKGDNYYFIVDKNGVVERILPIPRLADSSRVAATVFDLNGDGGPEIIIYADKFLRIFDGKNGSLVYEQLLGTTQRGYFLYQSLVVADVDNDGRAELVVTGLDESVTGHVEQWVKVFGARNNDWQNTRRIWNQAGYHVTNVNDDDSVPRYETPSWLTNNSYHCNVATSTGPNPYLAADLSASYLRLDLAGYPNSASVTARIGNGGAKTVPPGTKVSAYDGDPANGGTLIGTAATTKTLESGQFEDVTIAWSTPAEGSHTITVMVDPDATVPECDKANNTVSIQTVVSAGKPDPSIAAEDISIAATIPEGSLAEVAVSVRNVGTLKADNVVVRLYAGNPATGGKQIGTDQIVAALAAGSTTTLNFTWNTLGAVGTTYLYALVDPDAATADVNRGNNSAFRQVTVAPAVKPDLQLSAGDVSLPPASASEGEVVSVAVDVHNRGTATGNVKVNLYNGNPATGGSLVQSTVIQQAIPSGGIGRAVLTLDTIGLTGNIPLFVKVDPDNDIDEAEEGNNQASQTLAIDSAGLKAVLATDQQSYSANENAVLTLSVAEFKAQARNLACDLQLKDANGVVAATVAAGLPAQVPAGAAITLPLTWNTGTTYSGAYTILATITENGRAIARASAPFIILPVRTATVALVVDKVSYDANEAVAITTNVTGTSPNYIFNDLSATVTVADAAAGTVFTQTRPIPALSNGQRVELKHYWNTGTFAPGEYTALLELKDPTGALIASGATVIRINSIVRLSALLQGNIAVDKESLFAGDAVNVSYSLKNVGNRDLANLAVSVVTVNVANETVYSMLSSDISLSVGATSAQTGAIDTSAFSAKDYLVILRTSLDGVEETIAGTYFRVEGAPTAPSLEAPAQAADLEALPVTLSVGNAADPNDDRLSYYFEIYSDSSLTTLVESGTVSETAGSTAWTASAPLVENATYFWRARAFDGILYGPWMTPASFRVNMANDIPTAPTISTPVSNSDVASLTPELTVDNSTDPDSTNLTYNFEVALDPDFSQVVVYTRGVSGGAASTSWTVPETLQENTTYYWRAQADDWLIEGPWSATGSFFVNTAADAPSVPVITSPVNDSTVASMAADAVVANSTDPDSPAISYFFEADTVPNFDSGNVMRSAGIAQGSGSTSWPLAGLSDNTRYYLRAKASDGTAESAWSAVTTFFANTANDAPTVPVLANPSNGAGVNVFAPLLSIHNAADLDHDALSYEFELYADAALSNLVARTEGIAETPQTTQWQVPLSLTENQTYYWRSRAFDGNRHGEWMPAASFTINTANDAPGAPRLSSPADGAGVETSSPVLAVLKAADPDSDTLTYNFELYQGGTLASTSPAITDDATGVISWTPATPLADNTVYQWRVRAHDGDSYGAWMDMTSFTVHIPKTSITATVDFDPDTLNRGSNGSWVVVHIELPQGYKPADVDLASIRLEGSIPAEVKPSCIGDHDKDGIADLMVKFRRSDVISKLDAGDKVPVHVTGTVGAIMFDGVDVIRVIK
jgi:subtilase family serine protease